MRTWEQADSRTCWTQALEFYLTIQLSQHQWRFVPGIHVNQLACLGIIAGGKDRCKHAGAAMIFGHVFIDKSGHVGKIGRLTQASIPGLGQNIAAE